MRCSRSVAEEAAQAAQKKRSSFFIANPDYTSAMTWGTPFLAVLLAASASGQVLTGSPQGTTPKEKAADYPGHGQAGKVTIAVENWGHGFNTPWGAFAADDFIVIEVALFSDTPGPLVVNSGQFRLRLNKKTMVLSQAPGMVAASIKYPDWERRKELIADIGVGGGDIVLGRKRPVERFPGDPRPRQEQPNGPVPRAPGAGRSARSAEAAASVD